MYRLRRLSDNMGEEGRISQSFNQQLQPVGDRPIIGCVIVVSNDNKWWCTTKVTEITEDTENYVKFKTLNSVYEWTKLL